MSAKEWAGLVVFLVILVSFLAYIGTETWLFWSRSQLARKRRGDRRRRRQRQVGRW